MQSTQDASSPPRDGSASEQTKSGLPWEGGRFEAAGSSRTSDGAGPSSRFREAAPSLLGMHRAGRPSSDSKRFGHSAIRSDRRRTGHPRRAMHPGDDAFGKRFAPTRPTGDGRFRSPLRDAGWLDLVELRTPYRSRSRPALRPAAAGARGAPLFSAIFLEAPGSGRTSRTMVRGVDSLAWSSRAARGHAQACRHSTPHPARMTRLATDRPRPRPPCATRRDAFRAYAHSRHESICFQRSPRFSTYRTLGRSFPGGGSR
jgi:hypothetical protein